VPDKYYILSKTEYDVKLLGLNIAFSRARSIYKSTHILDFVEWITK